MGNGGSPLAFWISVSLALHLVAAAAWLGTPTAPTSTAQARQLALRILDGEAQRQVTDPGETPRQVMTEPVAQRAETRATQRTVPTPVQTRQASQPTEQAVPREIPNEPVARAPAPSAPSEPTAQAPRVATEVSLALRLQTRLLELLATQLQYPALAQRRGWEGVVLMELRLEANGDISRLQVLESSGFPLLDRAATRGLQRVARLPQAHSWLRGEAFELVLPVHYRLIDS